MPEPKALAFRRSMIEGRREVRHGEQVVLCVLAPVARYVLRKGPVLIDRLGEIAGPTFAQPINHWSSRQGRTVVRLGPDEWLLLLHEADGQAVVAELQLMLVGVHHALIDVSHAQIGLELKGSAATDVLNTGCPLDLGARQFPVGRGTRTVLGKAEIVLLRLPDAGNTQPAFRIECARSFGRYVYDYLTCAADHHLTAGSG